MRKKKTLLNWRNPAGIILVVVVKVLLGKLDREEDTDKARTDVQVTAQEGTGDKRQ